jgi:hypothetical protein
MTRTGQGPSRAAIGGLMVVGLVVGIVVAVLASDVILGVTAGASFIAVTVGVLRLWTGSGAAGPRHS